MASLNTFLTRRQVVPNEDNLERGQVQVFCPGTEFNDIPYAWCYNPPGCGTVIFEAWGAGGSGGKMCCCGGGIAANTGAYTKVHLRVNPSTIFCGTIGFPCTCDNVCFKGCSEATCWCWNNALNCDGSTYNGCICAQGGYGGTAFCLTAGSVYCCFRASGWCNTPSCCFCCCWLNCGIVCNIVSGGFRGAGYISSCCCENDKGVDSNISCTAFYGCQSECNTCHFINHLAIPPGLYNSKPGGTIAITAENTNGHSYWSGQGPNQIIHAINALTRFPGRGIPYSYCWACMYYGCREETQCQFTVPVAWGGISGFPCSAVRDHGMRGGMGAAKFTYYSYLLP